MRFMMRVNGLIAATAWFGSLTCSGEIALSVGHEGKEAVQTFESIEAAIEGARQLPVSAARKITLSGGYYYLTEPLVLDERDSNLTIEAEVAGEAALVGGLRIENWRSEGEFWVADLSETMPRDFRMLLVNGRYAPWARFPAEGLLQHETKFAPGWRSTVAGGWSRAPTEEELTTLRYRPEDLDPWLNPDNAEIRVYHNWDETLVGVKEIDRESHTITFKNPAGHPPGGFGIQDYVVFNVREGMTEPGQWYLDRSNGRVVYWPKAGETMATTKIIAPVMETVLRIEGKEESKASNITLRGLKIMAANTPLKKGGFGAKHFDGAVSVNHSFACIFEDLEITGVAGFGMRIIGDEMIIRNCHVHQIGAGGINLYSADAVVEENLINHVGLTYPSAIALAVGSTDPHDIDWEIGKNRTGVTIRHNEIHETPYTGMAFGGAGHVIEYNLIYRTMRELRDGSGMYITFCENLVLRNNVVRDSYEGHKTYAYYLDELTHNALIENNISMGQLSPLQAHISSNNLFRNNFFITDGYMPITLPRCEDMRFEKNVFMSNGDISITNPEGMSLLRRNIFFSKTGNITGTTLDRYRRVKTQPFVPPADNSLEDPGIRVEPNGRITFEEDSLAGRMGIRPVDGSRAGRSNSQ